MKRIFLSVFIILLLFIVGCKKKVVTHPGALKKGTPEYKMNVGLFHLNEGKIDLAEKKLLEVVKKRPDMLKALNGLGIVYIYKRDFKKSIKYFNKVLKISPGFHDANNSLGLIYTELGEYNLAKENLLIAANSENYSNPENAFHNLAKLEFSKKKYDNALRYANKGLEHDKRFAPLLNMKGLILESKGNYLEALKFFNKARKVLATEDVNFLINLGRVYMKLGNKNKALDMLEKALSFALTEDTKKLIRNMIKQIE